MTFHSATTRFDRTRAALRSLAVGVVVLAGASADVRAQQPSAIEAATALERVMVETIESQGKSVVAIAIDRRRRGKDDAPLRPFDPSGLRRLTPESPDFIPAYFGTGVIVDRTGLVLTNYHVLGIENDDYVVDHYITTIERKVYRAKIKAADPRSDLAVLQVVSPEGRDATLDWKPIRFGDAKGVKPGRMVLTLGNPYAIARDGQASAGWGIIANVARKAGPVPDDPKETSAAGKSTLHHYGTLLQIDARLNLGASGGALLDLSGDMIGLTTSIAAQVGYETPAGYAIPVDDAFRRIVDTLKEGREVEYGFLGVQPTQLATEEIHRGLSGVRIDRVVRGTPAEAAGLRRGDVVMEVEDRPVYDADSLVLAVGRLRPEQTVRLTVLRGESRTRIVSKLTKQRVVGRTIATSRPAAWRGIRVDYPTAVLPIQHLVEVPTQCVAIADVERDSPAARQGLQRGMLIRQVAGQAVDTPERFQRAVADRRGRVELERFDATGVHKHVLEQE